MLVRGLRHRHAGERAATVKLDPLFAQHVHTDDYHVFLTEHDENHHLHVDGADGAGFTVQADAAAAKAKGKNGGDVSGTFSWRVVAKRNDIKGERLPVWEMPTPAFTKPEPPAPAPLPGKKPNNGAVVIGEGCVIDDAPAPREASAHKISREPLLGEFGHPRSPSDGARREPSLARQRDALSDCCIVVMSSESASAASCTAPGASYSGVPGGCP